jgi:hypothetical protein
MNNLPDPDMKPEDADKLIKSYRQPIDPARKAKLIDKLKGQRQAFEKAQEAKRTKRTDKGNEGERSR